MVPGKLFPGFKKISLAFAWIFPYNFVTMTHKEIYYHLVKEENAHSLEELFKKEGILRQFNARKLEIHPGDDFPYILLLVKSKEIFAAMFIGIFVDIQALLPTYANEWYYLPLILFCPHYSRKIQKLIDRELSILHETAHIKDILDLIEKQPGYPETVHKYNMNNDDLSLADLEKSIDFEISKLFYLEPRALSMDFANGETDIYNDMLGKILSYPCESAEEYVQLKIINYKNKIKKIYGNKFPEEHHRIEELLIDAINKYGKAVYGTPAYPHMHQREGAYLLNRMAAFLVSRTPGSRS